ncbi:MAG: hypothetical protein NWE78_02345 [Candidatus Bathyarchaeota archaeon]|nr:hypothetical protein [Candidatus Bathyarchaeota archaeon]
MEEIRVVQYGIGAVGCLIARHLLQKEGLKLVGAIDKAREKVGKDLGYMLSLDRPLGIKVSSDPEPLLSNKRPHIVIHTTSSYLTEVFPQLVQIVKNGANVVSTCEELSYPYYSEPQLAGELDRLAKTNGVTVLGTGINPGFLMDTLVIALSAVCQEIEEIRATRVMNAGTRRVPFQRKIGAGLEVAAFREAIKIGNITGHVGLEQSISMIAAALAWELKKIQIDPVEPIIASKPVESHEIRVKAGYVAGLRQTAKGCMNEKKTITLDFQAYIGAREEYDSISIKGVPPVNQKITPCVNGDVSTVAMVVNAIPKVISARAGLMTMKDLPVPSATSNNILKHLQKEW